MESLSRSCETFFFLLDLVEGSDLNVDGLVTGIGTQSFLVVKSTILWMLRLPRAIRCSATTASALDHHPSKPRLTASHKWLYTHLCNRVNSLTDAQFQVEVAVLEGLVNYAKTKAHATQVALIGHSYGSYISSGAASHVPVDGLVLTGFSGTFDYFAPFVAGAGLRVAKTQNPFRWGHLDSGYLTTSDLYAETYVYYAEPHFEHTVAEYTFNVASEPFAVGELPSVLATTVNYKDIKAPVLVLQGQFDVSACGGNCVGVVNGTKELFTGAKVLEYVDNLPAG